METKNAKFSMIPLWICIGAAVLARAVGIVNSFLATDVVYSGTLICNALSMIKQILSDLSFACIAAAVVIRVAAAASAKVPVLVYLCVLIGDSVLSITYDTVTGVIPDMYWLIIGIGQRLLSTGVALLLILAGYLIAKAMVKRNIAEAKAALIAAVIPVAIDLLSVLWDFMTALIENEFLPYPSELTAFAYDVGTVVLSGAVSAVAAVVLVRICKTVRE